MKNWLATFTNTNGSPFPNTGAVNASGGAATDGTEFIADMVNDSMWGWQQALMDHVGFSPNGILEAVGASQILEALQKFEIPGKIISGVFNDDPAVLGIRAIMLTGQGILRANYVELDNNIYVGDGNNLTAPAFYHADDAAGVTRNIAGIYLILPDARGRVVRGLDLTGSVDPDGAGRALGDGQGSAMWSHWHAYYTDPTYDTGGGATIDNIALAGISLNSQQNRIQNPISDGVNPAPNLSSESRMINISANLLITY